VFLKEGVWFSAKSHGYGAGLPVVWQGWALMAAHIGLLAAIGLALHDRPVALIPLLVLAGAAPIPIYAARTEGGWRWRWGRAGKRGG
jgi:hypothetical protein